MQDQINDIVRLYNGSIIQNSFLPVEVLIRIFEYFDVEDLLNLQMVCKQWYNIITKFIWIKKGEIVFQRKFPRHENISWTVYYAFTRTIFNHNIVKNNCGEDDFVYWTLYTTGPTPIQNMLRRYDVPWAIPELPNDPMFRGKEKCSFPCGNFYKLQIINLSGVGYTTNFLDILQPPIEFSLLFTGKPRSAYRVGVFLLDDKQNRIDRFFYSNEHLGKLANKWNKLTHVFQNYGRGVASIRICDLARKGCRVTGISIKVLPPETLPSNYVEAASDLIPNFKEWHRNAEYKFRRRLPFKPIIPCDVYWLMSELNFNSNLILNNSGAYGLRNWKSEDGNCYTTWGVRNAIFDDTCFPKISEFRRQRFYFICGFGARYQDINLREKGFSAKVMDLLQPPIEVSVWYSCNGESQYKCFATLFRSQFPPNRKCRGSPLPSIIHMNGWCKLSYVFNNYGSGVKWIRIFDYGTHNETKVTRVAVKLLQPVTLPNNFEVAFM